VEELELRQHIRDERSILFLTPTNSTPTSVRFRTFQTLRNQCSDVKIKFYTRDVFTLIFSEPEPLIGHHIQVIQPVIRPWPVASVKCLARIGLYS